jgi:hypothetical protein
MAALMPEGRFPPPWSDAACFIVRDHDGKSLVYVYFEEGKPGPAIGGAPELCRSCCGSHFSGGHSERKPSERFKVVLASVRFHSPSVRARYLGDSRDSCR